MASKYAQPICLCNADPLPHHHDDDRIVQMPNYQRPNVHIPKMDMKVSDFLRRGFRVAEK